MSKFSGGERDTFWRELIDRRTSRRLTVREVCEQAGVSQGSFYQWQKKFRVERLRSEHRVGPTTPLVPVRIVDDRSREFALELPNGVRVLIPPGCDEVTLQRVVCVAMAATRETESC
jgi:transposase-like protein